MALITQEIIDAINGGTDREKQALSSAIAACDDVLSTAQQNQLNQNRSNARTAMQAQLIAGAFASLATRNVTQNLRTQHASIRNNLSLLDAELGNTHSSNRLEQSEAIAIIRNRITTEKGVLDAISREQVAAKSVADTALEVSLGRPATKQEKEAEYASRGIR